MNKKNIPPLLTVGILSWNRLYYLRATLESAKRCIQYPNIQWIVVDNISEEPGLAEYLKNQAWIDELVFLKSDHVTAMNEVVNSARGELLLMWPDDMQFIVEGDWMLDCAEILLENEWIGSMGLNCQRRKTLENTLGAPLWKQARPVLSELKWFGRNLRFPCKLSSTRGFGFYTYGWKADGVVGSGIPSLTRTEVWKKLGPWKATRSNRLVDSSGGGETEMLQRWRHMGLPLQRATLALPVAADIINDKLGSKAKVRKNTRYGVYTPPPEGTFYYEIISQAVVAKQGNGKLPLAFEDFVHPIGFDLPLDQHGDLLKNDINTEVAQVISDQMPNTELAEPGPNKR